MNYMTTIQASEKWGISSTRITILAKSGRIPGAVQMGSRWMIPGDASKPADGRMRAEKAKKQSEELCFRYPTYEGHVENSVFPPLSEEEVQLKHAIEALYACRFEEAEQILADLPERVKNRYLRINALRVSCTCSIFLNRGRSFLDCYGKLTAETQGDFPHKIEMRELVYELDATLGDSSHFSDGFRVEAGYPYHESFLPHLGALCTVSLFFSDSKKLTPETLRAHELYCTVFDRTKNYVDSQTMHLYLGCSYALLGMTEEMTVHLRRALMLAQTHQLYFGPVTLYYYMERSFEPALADFSEEFRAHLKRLSNDVHRRYVRFMDAMSMNSYFKLLRNKEYIFILYANQGYQNKEIAKRLHISVRTVSKRYNEIYDLLGVRNKRELAVLANSFLIEDRR